MVRFKIAKVPFGWLAVSLGILATAAVYGAGFVYAGTLPSPRDFTPLARGLLLGASALLTVGVFRLVKEQQRDASAVRDAWLLSGALAALSWVCLVRPALGHTDTAYVAYRVAFAAVDVVLATLLVLLAIPQSGYRLRRVRVAGMVHLAANTVFAMTGLHSNFAFTSPLVLAYLGFYLLLFGMGVRGHLQRRANPEAESGKPTRAVMRSARVAVLSSVPIATGVAVAIAVAAEPRGSAMAVAAVAAVLITLAAVRLRELHTADSKLVDALRDKCDELHDRNGQLVAESERALASLREASDFLTDMTERVASPLNGVLESGDDLRDAMASAPHIGPHVEKLVRSSDTLLFIVNDLLGISEASAPAPAACLPFSPRVLLTDVGESFVDAAASRGSDLVVAVDDAVPNDVIGPRTHIDKVLRIFVDNAVKFSKNGEIELTATFIDRRMDGSMLIRFAVHDGGIGMSREHRQNLLTPARDVETPNRRYRCKPHGLAVVPALVELVGGDWGVESELGRGSTFWFSARVEAAQAEVAEPVAELPQAPVEEHPIVVAYEPAPQLPPEPDLEPIPVAFAEPAPEFVAAAHAEPEPEPEPELIAAAEPEPEPEVVAAAEPEPEPELEPDPALIVAAEPEPEPEPAPEPAPVETTPEPIDDELVFEDESAEDEETYVEPEPVRMHGRVLLAEDNPLNRRVTLVALQNAGFRVEVATNGAEAVDAVYTGAYDAILMDCEMPVLDGFEATIEIRKLEGSARRTPIIALTVHSTEDDQLRAAAAGMDDFISKPFDTRTLLIKLSRWVPQNATMPAN